MEYELYNYKSKFKTGIWNAYNENGDLQKSVNFLPNGERKILHMNKNIKDGLLMSPI